MRKHHVTLLVTSALTAVLFLIHVVQDYVRGVDKLGPQSVGGIAILLVWLLGALVLGERRAGQVIMLLAGFFATGIAVLHLNGSRIGEVWKSNGAFAFILVLLALGVTGALSFILAIVALRRGARAHDTASPVERR